MRKSKFDGIVLGIFIAMIFIVNFAAADAVVVTSSTTMEKVDWTAGASQPASIAITFTNLLGSPDALPLTITKSGDTAAYISMPATLSLANATGSVVVGTLTFNIPNDVRGIKYGFLTVQCGEGNPDITISIILEVEGPAVSGECRIFTRPTKYQKTIDRDSVPSSKTFQVFVSSECIGGIDLSAELGGELRDTERGQQPARIKEENLGLIEPGGTGDFIVEFDVSSMESRTYNIDAEISGIWNDTLIIKTVPITITSLSPGAPYVNSTSLREPQYTIPTQVNADQEFNIEIKELNPNIIVFVEMDDDLTPIKQTLVGGTLVYTLKTNATGSVDVSFQPRDKATLIPLFRTRKFSINVLGGSSLPSSAYMKFGFYPTEENIRPGDNVSIVIRDNETNNIIDAELYVNNQPTDSTILNNVVGGTTYYLSAVNQNYNTLDYELTIPMKDITMTIEPAQPEVGSYAKVTIRENDTGNELHGSVFLDGNSVSETFMLTTAGPHTVTVEVDGYRAINQTIDVRNKATVLSASRELEKNKTAYVTFDGPTQWVVYYRENARGQDGVVSSGNSANIEFIPAKPGFYKVTVKGATISEWELEDTGLDFGDVDWRLAFIVVIIIVIVVLVLYFFAGKGGGSKKGGGGVGYPSSGYLADMGK